MAEEIVKLLWADLAAAPPVSGIYAWYCAPQISNYDLDSAIRALEKLRRDDLGEAERKAEALLEERIFRQFTEEPYSAVIKGPLKPVYSGILQHEVRIAPDLVSRIVEDPERLRTIRDTLGRSSPVFASPLYIGMTQDLKARLDRHKRLILAYRKGPERKAPGTSGEAGFAWQVVKREISPERLMVFVCPVPNPDETVATDIEHILNRLYYPVLGKN